MGASACSPCVCLCSSLLSDLWLSRLSCLFKPGREIPEISLPQKSPGAKGKCSSSTATGWLQMGYNQVTQLTTQNTSVANMAISKKLLSTLLYSICFLHCSCQPCIGALVISMTDSQCNTKKLAFYAASNAYLHILFCLQGSVFVSFILQPFSG